MASGAAPWVQNAVGGSPVGQTLTLEKVADERVLGRGGFALTSAAFRHDGELDPSFTAVEEDAVAPPLEWTAPPPAHRNWYWSWRMPIAVMSTGPYGVLPPRRAS